MDHGLEEHPDHAAVAELAEAAVGGEDAAANDAKAVAMYTLREEIVFGKESALVEATEMPEGLALEKHEHAGGKGLPASADVLHDVVASVEEVVEEPALAAADADGTEVEVAASHGTHGATEQGGVGELDVGVEEKDVLGAGELCAGVAADRRKATGDDFDQQAVTEGECCFDGAVG